jgi:hypothetical protein
MVIPALRLGGSAATVAIALLLYLPGTAPAATKGVALRVIDSAGHTLAEHQQYTGSVRIKTDPDADCFGQGTGGSGDRVPVAGATALGAVSDALRWDGDLRPLSVTDTFVDDGFGLGVCGIGGVESQGSSFWYLKADHVGAQVSGSQLTLHRGERILWYLTPSYPPPAELELRAPARAEPGVPYEVTAFSYGDDGTRTAAVGASVDGADQPTDAAGHTMVTSASAGSDVLRATHGPDIPSNHVKVCVNADASACPVGHGKRIYGSHAADRVHGTRGVDIVKVGPGDDRVNIRGGGADRVSCGGGADRVIAHRGDHDDQIASSCERVIRT